MFWNAIESNQECLSGVVQIAGSGPPNSPPRLRGSRWRQQECCARRRPKWACAGATGSGGRLGRQARAEGWLSPSRPEGWDNRGGTAAAARRRSPATQPGMGASPWGASRRDSSSAGRSVTACYSRIASLAAIASWPHCIIALMRPLRPGGRSSPCRLGGPSPRRALPFAPRRHQPLDAWHRGQCAGHRGQCAGTARTIPHRDRAPANRQPARKCANIAAPRLLMLSRWLSLAPPRSGSSA
jgi:hypothetical protein